VSSTPSYLLKRKEDKFSNKQWKKWNKYSITLAVFGASEEEDEEITYDTAPPSCPMNLSDFKSSSKLLIVSDLILLLVYCKNSEDFVKLELPCFFDELSFSVAVLSAKPSVR